MTRILFALIITLFCYQAKAQQEKVIKYRATAFSYKSNSDSVFRDKKISNYLLVLKTNRIIMYQVIPLEYDITEVVKRKKVASFGDVVCDIFYCVDNYGNKCIVYLIVDDKNDGGNDEYFTMLVEDTYGICNYDVEPVK
jgi:hypothetical protein